MKITIQLSKDMLEVLQSYNKHDRERYLQGLLASDIKHTINKWAALIARMDSDNLAHTTFSYDFTVEVDDGESK